MNARTTTRRTNPTLARLGRLADLSAADRTLLGRATQRCVRFAARKEIGPTGLRQSMLVLQGWAYRSRDLRDGRRQILGFILPGDVVRPFATTAAGGSCFATVALTETLLCPAPPPGSSPSLDAAYAASAGCDEMAMLRHITRLGRMTAIERTADLLLELHERLLLAGTCPEEELPLPLTQEILADALGLTGVHVNRTLQIMRREGMVSIGAGTFTLIDEVALAELADRPI